MRRLFFILFSICSYALCAPASADSLANPVVVGPLNANNSPYKADIGPLGEVYIGGILTGMGMSQSNSVASDDSSNFDLTNGQIIVQKTQGLVQFFAQAGGYSLPSLGTSYTEADDATDDFYGPLPVAYLKLAPTENWSFMVGKLPTLIGAEYTFTFQNMNIERGLLWNQENAITRGFQINYSDGKLASSLSFGDGFYSEEYNWLSGIVSYAINEHHALAFAGGTNLGDSSTATIATPLLQNNSSIYNLMYTYTDGPLTVAPYLQYTHVDENPSLGIMDDAETYGAAILSNYSYNENWSIASRLEYIYSNGRTTNLLYGPDSSAKSLTITPTWQQGLFFTRGEASYVSVDDSAVGGAFGNSGNDQSQARFMLETGIIF